jgi:hypothetical protein
MIFHAQLDYTFKENPIDLMTPFNRMPYSVTSSFLLKLLSEVKIMPYQPFVKSLCLLEMTKNVTVRRKGVLGPVTK